MMNPDTKKETGRNETVVTDTLNFTTQLEPIFKKNCSPCHFPGGKLYKKLPFDNREIIVDHQTGILRRITNLEEVNLIKSYADQYKSVLHD